MKKFISFILGSNKASQAPPVSVKARIHEGLEAYEKGKRMFYSNDKKERNDNKALLLFDLAIECGIYDAYLDRAFCLQGLGFHYDAIVDFDKAIQKSSGDANLHFGRGHSKQSIGQYDEAISDLKTAIELSKIDNELNRNYNIEMKKSGWSSVSLFYESRLNYILLNKKQSEEDDYKEFYQIKISKIKRRNEKITNFGFPSYIGFGRLKTETVFENEKAVSADYFFNNRLVHRIVHNKIDGGWMIKDIYNETGAITSSTNLEKAVLNHFNNLDCKTNGIFHFVKNEVCKLGDIYFENLSSMKDEGGVASYFPAGRLVILRLPIFMDGSGRAMVDILSNRIPYIEKDKKHLLKLCEAYNTSILLAKKDGEISAVPVLMFEYVITLASIYEVIKWMSENNLLEQKNMFRLIIQDSKLKNQHHLQMFEYNHSKFTILFKGLDDTKIKFDEFEKNIIKSNAGR